MLVYYFVPFIVGNRYLLFWVSNGHNSVTVQNRTHVYMNFFHHKNLGNHLLQLCPKVVKHPVCWSYQTDKRVKPGNFVTGNSLSENGDNWIKEEYHFDRHSALQFVTTHQTSTYYLLDGRNNTMSTLWPFSDWIKNLYISPQLHLSNQFRKRYYLILVQLNSYEITRQSYKLRPRECWIKINYPQFQKEFVWD